uniref:Phosphatidate cytidylyltransferase n=1 Tax=Ammonifex degensii TaxID=42838 RepID=A0A7C2IPC0_9THEO
MVSAAAGIPVIILAAWWGKWPLLLLVSALYFAGLREMLRLLSGVGLKPPPLLAYLGGLILVAATYAGKGVEGALVYVLLVCVVPLVFLFPRYTPPEAGIAFISVAYLSLFLYLYLLRLLPDGWYWLLLALVSTWSFDTAAYFAGRLWGRRRLTPNLSPGKSVEGLGAGLLVSAAAATLFALWLPVSPLRLGLLGLAVGAAGQIGDLVVSAVKRATGHKDAGSLIPGHGGVLDRFDSFLLTAPLVYFVARWLAG